MFGSDRMRLRRYYAATWHKVRQGQTLDALETQIAAVLTEHPEYQSWVVEDKLETDFVSEQGQVNPFLHMSLHLGLREQVATDRPTGIRALYHALCLQYDPHDLEHRMMACLANSMWQAQQHNTPPDEIRYLACLEQLRQS